jgi:hypothetical protein
MASGSDGLSTNTTQHDQNDNGEEREDQHAFSIRSPL